MLSLKITSFERRKKNIKSLVKRTMINRFPRDPILHRNNLDAHKEKRSLTFFMEHSLIQWELVEALRRARNETVGFSLCPSKRRFIEQTKMILRRSFVRSCTGAWKLAVKLPVEDSSAIVDYRRLLLIVVGLRRLRNLTFQNILQRNWKQVKIRFLEYRYMYNNLFT